MTSGTPACVTREHVVLSDHHGLYITLAYSDWPQGPWLIHAPPVLTLGAVYTANCDTFNLLNCSESAELASPDVFVDHVNKRIGMYFHARVPSTDYAILTSVAFAENGLNFTNVNPGFFTTAYARHFWWRGDSEHVYLLDRTGQIVQTAADGYTNALTGGQGIGNAFANETVVQELNNGYSGLLRHLGVSVVGNTMYVFGTRVGDDPEHILWTQVDLNCISTNWSACAAEFPAVTAFESEYWYEGVNDPIVPSVKGTATGVHQLRDPYPFHGPDGNCYIYYAGAGESYINGAIIPPAFCFETLESASRAP